MEMVVFNGFELRSLRQNGDSRFPANEGRAVFGEVCRQ